MSRWDKAVVGAVCIASGYAALVLSLVAARSLELRSQRKTAGRQRIGVELSRTAERANDSTVLTEAPSRLDREDHG